ncbi:hypothetical protein JCM30394_19320 [Deferrisoma palaeochoriense]
MGDVPSAPEPLPDGFTRDGKEFTTGFGGKGHGMPPYVCREGESTDAGAGAASRFTLGRGPRLVKAR